MGRRGNGEGSIRRRSDGRWEARITLDGDRTKSVYAKTRVEAAQKLTALLRDRDRGLPIMREQQTLQTYLASWLDMIKPSIKTGTYQRYADVVRLHVVPVLGRIRLARLTAQQVQNLYAAKLSAGLAPGTVRHLHAVLHRALEDAMRLGLIARNVADLVTLPRSQRSEMHVLTPAQAQQLLQTARGHHLEALYVLALTTGMRQGELLALRWADVDLDGAALQVMNTLKNHSGRWYLEEPKSARSRRRIQLTPMAVEALRRHRTTQLQQRLELGPAWQDNDFVFTRADGSPLRGTILLQWDFHPLLRRAGLPQIRFHDLRHTAATLLLLQGIHPKVVSELLGHSTVSMTLDRYSHVLPDMQASAAAAMERLLKGS